MNQLVRWTFGPVSEIGKDILRESVSSFRKLYPSFDRVVCYNHVSRSELTDIDADLHEQKEEQAGFPLRPPDNNPEEASGCGWKLCPARLCPDGHELWLDNDVLILRRLQSLDSWMTHSSATVISEGLKRKRMYGEFDAFVRPGLHLCAGLFGLPPNFNFSASAAGLMKSASRLLGGYDEQGLTAAIVTSVDDWILAPSSELHISEDHVPLPEILPPAIHFVGANRKPWHRGWRAYQRRKII